MTSLNKAICNYTAEIVGKKKHRKFSFCAESFSEDKFSHKDSQKLSETNRRKGHFLSSLCIHRDTVTDAEDEDEKGY